MSADNLTATRQARPADQRTCGSRPSEDVLATVLAVVSRAKGLLESDSLPEAAEIGDLPTASRALNAIWEITQAALRGDRRAADRFVDTEDLLPLLIDARAAEERVREEQRRQSASMVANVQQALARFRPLQPVPDLIEAAPAAVCSLGFDRALFSRLEESMWIPETGEIDCDREWADLILQTAKENPQRLIPNLFETEMVRRGQSLLVRNVREDQARVNQVFASATQTRGYVGALVMPGDQVIGFLHADNYYQRDEVSDYDRDILAMFAEAFGYVLERAMLAARLEDLRARAESFAAGIAETAGGGFSGTLNLNGRSRENRSSARPERTGRWLPYSQLTQRETEVLELMGAGCTNDRIASKLVISDATVKSHVKHILRKLGAANRAEAVSIWLNGRDERG